jgi:hypothetical protein
VIGADGLHSTVRRLAFGPERDFVRHLGLYVATMRLGGPADPPHDLVMYNLPGRLVALHPSRADAVVVFIFRSPAIDGLDHRDTGQHREVLGRAYAGAGWRVPAPVARAAAHALGDQRSRPSCWRTLPRIPGSTTTMSRSDTFRIVRSSPHASNSDARDYCTATGLERWPVVGAASSDQEGARASTSGRRAPVRRAPSYCRDGGESGRIGIMGCPVRTACTT